MEDPAKAFRERLPIQAEVCARKVLERLQKDLQGPQSLSAEDIRNLSEAADILLTMRDAYGEKRSQ